MYAIRSYYGHYDSIVPQCVQNYKIKTLEGETLSEITGNYQTINTLKLDNSIVITSYSIHYTKLYEVANIKSRVPARISYLSLNARDTVETEIFRCFAMSLIVMCFIF